MSTKLLLINPNNYKNPPVLPIGLEYIKESLRDYDCHVEILDLTFSKDILPEIKNVIENKGFDLIGLSIRNIDSCIYFNNEFFLPNFKKIIDYIKLFKIPIILGGSGFSASPKEILNYFQVDYGIIGPAEKAFPIFLELWKKNKIKEKIINGWQYGIDSELLPIRAIDLDYNKYLKNDGLVGFTTHVGCSNQCPYCIEANKKVHHRKIKNIIKEIEILINNGYIHYHLSDSEFNQDLKFCKRFCRELARKKFDFKWTLYMKPTPYDEEMFQLLSESNAYLITLSVDSYDKIQKRNNYSYDDLEKIIKYCKKYNIELVIDLLTGYPYESIESTKKIIGFFKKNRPKSVGISFYYRLFNNTELSDLIKKDHKLQEKLTRSFLDNEDCLNPIFYHQYNKEDIQELIEDEDLFKIAGISLEVNYQL
ncbi:MAG: cobalamin-dependent protein [Candidatus Lokiarchaeota archaeon]|nr:cobalamin-dependent protein [Candidatus Lokiarchaeota archaeon]